jgi:hypothetical protein
MFGRVRCLFLKHERSKREAKWDGTAYVSVCMHCGVRMFRTRDAKRSWQVDRRKVERIEDHSQV